MNTSKLHIIGSNGFIGKTVIKMLENSEINFNLISRNEIDLLSSKAIKYFEQNVNDNDSILFIAAEAPCKTDRNYHNNIIMANNFLAGIKHLELRTFGYVSSDAVYKDSQSLLSENSPVGVKGLHGQMHLARESLFKSSVNAKYIFVARPTLIYGNEDPHNGYGPNRFLRNALNGEPISIIGKGEEIRDHIHVDDVAKTLILLIQREFSGDINICSGNGISFMEIAELIMRIFPKVEIKFSERLSEMPHNGFRLFDLSKLLEFDPKIEFMSLKTYFNKFRVVSKDLNV
jgi:UDP-glucose 4-epimerase